MIDIIFGQHSRSHVYGFFMSIGGIEMEVDGKEFGFTNEEECKKLKKVASHYGVQVVCDEEES